MAALLARRGRRWPTGRAAEPLLTGPAAAAYDRQTGFPAASWEIAMAEELTGVRTSQEAGVIVAEFTDRDVLDEKKIIEIGEALSALIAEAAPPMLVLDFNKVVHMSSGALGMLIKLLKRISERGGKLRLCAVRASILEVFEITKLTAVFEIYENRQAAMASLA